MLVFLYIKKRVYAKILSINEYLNANFRKNNIKFKIYYDEQ